MSDPTGYHAPIDIDSRRLRHVRAGAPDPEDITLTDRSTESLVADALKGHGRIYTPEPRVRTGFLVCLGIALAGLAVAFFL